MAISFDDITFPGSFDIKGVTGGKDYQFYRRTSETNTHWFDLGDVKRYTVNEDFNPGIHEYEPYVDLGKIFDLPNGYSFHLYRRFDASSATSAVGINMAVHMHDENGNDLGQSIGVSGVTLGSVGFTIYSREIRSYAYTVPYTVVVFLNTVYYPRTPYTAEHPTAVNIALVSTSGMTTAIYDSGGNNLDAWGSGASVNQYDDCNNISGFPQQSFNMANVVTFTEQGLNNFNDWLHGRGEPFDGDAFPPNSGGGSGDPAGSDDPSEPGGGNGNYDDKSDPIDFPPLPTGGAIESGAIIAHRVVSQTLEVIFTKLWNLTLIDTWLKSLEDPMDAIVSLHALPVSPQVTDDPNNIYVGNLNMGVSSPLVTSQYVEVDCKSLTLKEYWGSALDYSPYTRVEIFLPFIGVRTLKTEDVMKTTIAIKYYVDILTGDCIAFIKCGMSVLYTFNGNCKMTIPLSARSTDALQKILMATGLAVAGGAVAVGGGAAATMQGGSLMLSGASNIATTKINVSRSGDVSGSPGIMGEYVPYLIIHRPAQSLAKDYNKFKGYTSNITSVLGNLSGYTEVEHVHLSVAGATDTELAEIEKLLKEGVII